MRVEHEYERCGAWADLAAWDVRRARIFGRCAARTGSEPFARLVQDVLRRRPYCSAARVFWITDNGSAHRGAARIRRLAARWPNVPWVPTPVPASWRNQVEIYFSIIQRKVLTPNDFRSLAELEDRRYDFPEHYQAVARPFEWKFTRRDLLRLLARLDAERKRSKSA